MTRSLLVCGLLAALPAAGRAGELNREAAKPVAAGPTAAAPAGSELDRESPTPAHRYRGGWGGYGWGGRGWGGYGRGFSSFSIGFGYGGGWGGWGGGWGGGFYPAYRYPAYGFGGWGGGFGYPVGYGSFYSVGYGYSGFGRGGCW